MSTDMILSKAAIVIVLLGAVFFTRNWLRETDGEPLWKRLIWAVGGMYVGAVLTAASMAFCGVVLAAIYYVVMIWSLA